MQEIHIQYGNACTNICMALDKYQKLLPDVNCIDKETTQPE